MARFWRRILAGAAGAATTVPGVGGVVGGVLQPLLAGRTQQRREVQQRTLGLPGLDGATPFGLPGPLIPPVTPQPLPFAPPTTTAADVTREEESFILHEIFNNFLAGASDKEMLAVWRRRPKTLTLAKVLKILRLHPRLDHATKIVLSNEAERLFAPKKRRRRLVPRSLVRALRLVQAVAKVARVARTVRLARRRTTP